MPIHDLGYRGWKGSLGNYANRWTIIAMNGVKIAARSQWIRRVVLFSLLPALSMGVFLFMYEQTVENRWLVGEAVVEATVITDSAILFSRDNGNSIRIADRYDNGKPKKISLSVYNGTLNLPNPDRLVFQEGDGIDDRQMTFTGQLNDINAALDGLTYTPTPQFVGKDSLIINTNGQGDVRGTLVTNGEKVRMNVVPVDALPVPGPSSDTRGRQNMVRRGLQNSPLDSIDPDVDQLINGLFSEADDGGRHLVWSWMFNSFFKYSQGAMMLLLVGLIAPPLISKDMRTRAFLLYFSRPIGRAEYIAGKIAIPAAFVSAITLVPAIALYFFAVLLAPDFSVVLDTWDIPLRIVAASLVAVVPASCLALMFSSLTTESRFAGFAWFAVWTLGGVAWLIIYGAMVDHSMYQSHRNGIPYTSPDSNLSMLSLYHTIGKVQRWVFGLESDFREVLPSIALLTGITVFSLLVLWRRVSAPLRV